MRRALRRTGLVLAGLVGGLLVGAIVLGIYFRAAQVEEIRSALQLRLNLPREVLEVEALTDEGPIRIALRQVAILDEDGDTIVAAPLARLWFDPSTLAGEGPIEFTDVELVDPYARLVQAPDGTWNIVGAMRVEAGGNEVRMAGDGEEESRPIVLRDVRIVDGRVLLAMPGAAPDTAGFMSRLQLPRTRMGGQWYQTYALQDVDARLPTVRFGGEQGWRVEVASLDTRLREPDLAITQLRGWAEAEGEDGVRFDVETLRFGGNSRLAAEGVVRFPEDEDAGPVLDVQVQDARLAFADLAALLPTLPAEGTAEFSLDIESRAGERIALDVSDLRVEALDSRVSGRLGLLVGGEEAPSFQDTELRLDPLRLLALEQLGLVDSIPFLGTIEGTLSTAGAVTGLEEGALRLNLGASLVPRDQPDATPSRITADGLVALGEEDAPLRMEGLRIQLQPLYLASLASVLPEQQERLRGEVRGAVVLNGTPSDLRASQGELIYRVGDAAPTRLTDLSGSVTLEPALRYSLQATAQPLALATLTELFPALPFRTALLSGPIRIEGNEDEVDFGLDLRGEAGGIRLDGTAQLGTPLRFSVEGRVASFTASAILQGELPVEGPVTGTFAANGTTEDFRFSVDLAQTAGKFALSGRVRMPGGPPQFEVAGQVENFRLGALIGRPGLFASPLTGRVQLTGGGREAYRFDLDLRGDAGAFDLEGFFRPGDVPEYAARGTVAGLDLRRLPFGGAAVPHTNLRATIDLEGRGTTLETLAGSLVLDARESTISGVPLDRARARLAVRNGILVVDTLAVELRDTRLSAEGMWGLTQPAPRPLSFALVAPNLSTLSRVISTPQLVQPQLAGSLQAQGTIGGSVRYPVIDAELQGRRLRYEEWRAGSLALSVEAARTPDVGWAGEAELAGESLVFAGGQSLQSLRVDARGTQQELAVSLAARRDAGSELALAGVLEFEGQLPRGVQMESLALRTEGTQWRLRDPARVRWGGVDGLLVENLVLERTGNGAGLIRVHGKLPPDGEADLQVQAFGVDLGDLRRIAGGQQIPDVSGRLTLDAVLEGPVGTPDLTLEARVDSLRYEGVQAEMVAIRGDYTAQRLETAAEIWMQGRQVAVAEAAIPMVLSLGDLVPSFELLRTAPLTARVIADSLPLELFTAAAPQLQNGRGVAMAQLSVRGTLDAPELNGYATLSDGAVRVVPMGVTYSDIQARLILEGNTVLVDTLAVRNGGTALVSGSVRFEPGGGPALYLIAELQNFVAMDTEDLATVTASGRLAISGDLPNPVLTGRVTLQESSFVIPELSTLETSTVQITDVEVGSIGADSLATGGVLPPFLAGLQIEVLEVSVGESVWLVSDEARVQIEGDLRIFRTGEDLRVFGLLEAVRGTYSLRVGSISREFDIVRGRVQFYGTADLNPGLEIVAANRVRTGGLGTGEEITILVNITGTMLAPRIRLSSDTPTPLSESELFSLLIFGRPSFQLGGLGTTQFAEQFIVQEFLGGILATELERPILASGLCDYVRVQPGVGASTFQGLLDFDPTGALGTLGTAAIECGKEITDELFATVETGIGALFAGDPSRLDWGVGLEWQIDREWMWELQYGPVRRGGLFRLVNPLTRYQFGTDIRRRWEYGKSRAPSALDMGPGDPLLGEIAPRLEPEPEGQQ